jgi:hypothetical protein
VAAPDRAGILLEDDDVATMAFEVEPVEEACQRASDLRFR